MGGEVSQRDVPGPDDLTGFDRIAEELRTLRNQAGQPSFSDLVRDVGRVREARGVAPELARPARSTVYDLFRLGRRRMDAELVGDVVQALGVDEPGAELWRTRCHLAAAEAEQRRRLAAATTDPPTPSVAPTEVLEAPHTDISVPVREPSTTAVAQTARRLDQIALVVLLGVLANLLGRGVVVGLELPLHLDMVGTALAAVAMGPWTAVVVAVLSSVLGVSMSGVLSLAFLPVAVAGALVWGYGVHRFALHTTALRFFALTATTAAVCSLVAWPVLVLAGWGGHSGELTAERVLAVVDSPVLAALLASLLLSLADKLIAGFCALALVDTLPLGPTEVQVRRA